MNVEYKNRSCVEYDRVLAAWQQQIKAAEQPELKQQLVNGERELLPRFAAQYTKLRALPRRARRAMQRQWKQSLAGVALLLALGQAPAMAATINVGSGCSLVNAITAANTNTATGGCPKGGGADTIVLPKGSTQILTTASDEYSLLPFIESVITIVGNGSTIKRGKGAPALSIFDVSSYGGNLALQRVTVSGGASGIANGGKLTLTNSVISGNTDSGLRNGGNLTAIKTRILGNSGPGLDNSDGVSTLTNSTISGNTGSGIKQIGASGLTLINSTISGNSATGTAGGVDNYVGEVIITNSTISGNSTTGDSGGVENYSGRATITNSTITRNSAARGGGVSNFYTGNLSLNRTLISGNSASSGREVFNSPDAGTLKVNNFNVFGFNGNAGISGFKKGATDIVPRVALAKVLKTTLANNGGPTKTHALVSRSPAVDAVSDGTCPPPARDQRGVKRPQDGNRDGGPACDSGSFEFSRGGRP